MRTTVSIPGICCGSCKKIIAGVSSLFPCIRHVDVDLDKKTVALQHEDDFDLRSWIALLEYRGHKFKIFAVS